MKGRTPLYLSTVCSPTVPILKTNHPTPLQGQPALTCERSSRLTKESERLSVV